MGERLMMRTRGLSCCWIARVVHLCCRILIRCVAIVLGSFAFVMCGCMVICMSPSMCCCVCVCVCPGLVCCLCCRRVCACVCVSCVCVIGLLVWSIVIASVCAVRDRRDHYLVIWTFLVIRFSCGTSSVCCCRVWLLCVCVCPRCHVCGWFVSICSRLRGLRR